MFPDVICPMDGQPVVPGAAKLVCSRGHEWMTDDGIPRMLPAGRNYADAFGLQWKTFRKTQLDSYCGSDISRRRARRCIGPEAWAFLQYNPGSDVLEAGCGAGRFTEILLETRARVTSVDLSSAVEANQENFPQDDRHRVLQADVLNLPFAPRQYHMVFCLGVIQHTPNPEATIAALFEQVRPGGWLVIDHYTHQLSRYTKTSPLFRQVVRRMTPDEGMKWTERLVEFFFPLHRAVRRSRVGQALVSRVSPVLTYFHCYDLTEELHRQWALLDTHDALTDWYKHLRTKGQIRRALERLGGVEISSEYGGNGVEARCRRSFS
jgi:2-polyprenyl-3-methyl-5-hydroxy-6-metoxy-1,4-benzoquinol methylase